MSVFGWILFVVGFALLIIGGFVGMDGIANLAALQSGGAMMVSGSVFILAAKAHLIWQATALTTEERDLGIVARNNGTYRVSNMLHHYHFDYENIGDAIHKAKTTKQRPR